MHGRRNARSRTPTSLRDGEALPGYSRLTNAFHCRFFCGSPRNSSVRAKGTSCGIPTPRRSKDARIASRKVREVRREAVAAAGLQHKLEHQRRIKELTAARNQRRKDLFIAQDEVEARREALIADIEGKLKQKQELTQLFAIRWRLE